MARRFGRSGGGEWRTIFDRFVSLLDTRKDTAQASDGLRVGILLMAVGVILFRQPMICPLDLDLCGLRREAEDS